MNPLPTDAAARKNLPIWKGVMKYFPRTMAAMAAVSVAGNEQHNPGEELHWSRGKSNDHLDCVARHMLGAGTLDDDGQAHSAKLAWRACANCEIELDAIALREVIQDKLVAVFPDRLTATEVEQADRKLLQMLAPQPGDAVPVTFYQGVPIEYVPSFDPVDIGVEVLSVETGNPACYLGGGMTGHDLLNFPAFDTHKEYLEQLGYDVISPADLDRAAGIDENDYRLGNEANWPKPDMRAILTRDIQALLSLRPGKDAIALMPDWEQSTGAAAEFFFARWWGLDIIDTHGIALDAGDVNFTEICTRMMKYLRERSK